ncbi:MAG: amidohydrolase family protein [Betaproteobacteria bacterium]
MRDRFRLAAGAVLLALTAIAPVRPAARLRDAAPVERERLRLHYVQKPIGWEDDAIAATRDGLRLTSHLAFLDRGGSVALDATLETARDYTPRHFTARGKSYRFVNVDSDVTIDGRTATVRADGVDRKVPLPARFFTVDGYAPFGAQLLLVRYWLRHGRPRVLQTVPGLPLNDVVIEARGRDEVRVGDRSVRLTQYVIDGVVWGRETAWLDRRGSLAALITRAGGLSFEAVREDLEPALVDLVRIAARDRIADLAALGAQTPPLQTGTYALVGGTVVVGTDRAPIENAAVLVRDGRIVNVGPRTAVHIPPRAPQVDVAGRTIVAGLWDMHTHFTQVEWAHVYLAAGVTTVRDMGNEFEFITAMRDAVESGRVLGPRLLMAGLVDAGGPNAFGVVYADTPEEAGQVVARYHDAGFEQIKIYSLVRPPIVAALSSEAHRLGMSVTGHLPNGMTIPEAVNAGMDGIAHLAIQGEAGSEPVDEIARFMARHQTVMDPTQSWNELLGRAAATPIASFQPGFAKIPPPLQRVFGSAGVAGIAPAAARARLERGLRIVKELHDAGVPVVAGTDEGVPGYSVDREIELYVEAGLTPLAALQAATIVPAKVMKLDGELGTVERGKRADLVVLDANPLEDIHNIRRVHWTIRDGRIYDPAALWKSVGFKP